MSKTQIVGLKLDIISEAVLSNKLHLLHDVGFFKTINQIEKSGKIRTHNRIWFGRMLKLVYEKSAPNPDGVAIFQAPDQFKRIRAWEKKKKNL